MQNLYVFNLHIKDLMNTQTNCSKQKLECEYVCG